MISYISGKLTFKTPAFVIVETCGIGYRINISLHTYAQLEKMESVKLLTQLIVKEDSHTLYGFAEEPERSMFVHLISVSGIGPATAQTVLSSMQAEEVRIAIITEDVSAFKRVKGIGPKTAKRVILDLKDKMLKDSGDIAVMVPAINNTMRSEALSALLALGYSRIQAQKALNGVIKSGVEINSPEDLVKYALKNMG